MSDSEYDEWGEGVMVTVMKMMVKMVVDGYNLKKQFKVQIVGIFPIYIVTKGYALTWGGTDGSYPLDCYDY